MKIRLICFVALAMVGMLIYTGCVSETPATPAVSGTKPVGDMTKITWQDDWNRTITEAKKEGEVSLYWHGTAEIQTIGKEFGEKYGIKVSILSARAPEIAERMSREYSAGIFNVDVVLAGWTTMLVVMEPKGLISPVDNMAILPEVTDPNKWTGGKFPWADPGHFAINFGAAVESGIWRNTELVKENEIKEFRDLLNPKWKGKMAFNDPTKIGAGSVWFRLYYAILGEDYMKALVKQEPVVSSDLRLVAEWLARGKYPVTLCANTENLIQFKQAGAPIEIVETKEGEYISPGPGSLTIANKLQHPNAAKLFINWILSKEGQTLWSQRILLPSFRVDVSADHLNAAVVRKPGKNYFQDTLETASQQGKYIELSKQIFASLIQ